MRKITAAIFSAFIFISGYAQSDTKIVGHMSPFNTELLPTSIKLPDCPGIEIVEWRPTPGLEQQSGPTNNNIRIMNEICKNSYQKFWPFIQSRKLESVYNQQPFRLTVSFMPAKLGFYGEDYRNLNDSKFRFNSREKRYDSDGSIIGIWGYTQYVPTHLFMRNDIIEDGAVNTEFAATFAHELYHSMSYWHKVFISLPGPMSNRSRMDEELANVYETFVGY